MEQNFYEFAKDHFHFTKRKILELREGMLIERKPQFMYEKIRPRWVVIEDWVYSSEGREWMDDERDVSIGQERMDDVHVKKKTTKYLNLFPWLLLSRIVGSWYLNDASGVIGGI